MKIMALVFMSVGLFACATDPKQEYAQLLEGKSAASAKSLKEAISNGSGTLLAKTKEIEFDIDSQDPTINIDDVISFYEVFSIEAKSGESISITSFSPIKSSPILYIVWPRIFIVDSEGNLIQDSMKNGKVSRSFAGFGALRYQADWDFTAQKGGKYHILVTSDNRILDENVGSTTETVVSGNVFLPVTYGFRAHSTGPMRLLLN